MTSKAGRLLGLVAAMIPVAILAAQQSGGRAPAGPGALSPRDRVEIEQLVARYAYAYDRGDDNCYAYADLFTIDGEFIGTRGHATGREELAQYCRGVRKSTLGVSHFIMNPVIVPSREGVTGRQYLIVVNIGQDQPGGEFSSVGGHYEDVYAKTPQGWRFRRREYVPIQFNSGAAPAAASMLPSVPGPAPQPTGRSEARPTSGLTAQDYMDIRALANLYAYGLDSGADNGTGSLYAAIFTEDAEFHGPPATPGGQPFDAKGRDALRKFAVPGRGLSYVRHFMSNHLIEPSAEGARGRVYLLVLDLGRDGKPTSVNMGGHYEDVYVKTAPGWRIKSRNFYRSKSAQTIEAEAK